MLEVGVGLAFGHFAPRSFAEQNAHEVDDAAVGEIFLRMTNNVETVLVMLDDVSGPAPEVFEGVPMSWKSDRHVAEVLHSGE